jgi:beta-lactamase regulating signal transducer with metallopeptidase domain
MILRKNRIAPVSGNLQDMYLTLCKERKVKPVPVYFTDPVPGACLVGVFRPYIVLPVMTAPQDVVTVLTHEICHLKNRDHIWNIFRLLCCIIHWFNPLVWIAASMSRSDCELRCDDRVCLAYNGFTENRKQNSR